MLEQRAHDAHELHAEIVQYCVDANKLFFGLGMKFTHIYNNRLHVELGFDNFADYVDRSPDITVSSSSAYKAMAVYRQLYLKLRIQPQRLAEIGIKKLDLICSRINEDNKEEMLANAEAQIFSQLRQTYPPRLQNRPTVSNFAIQSKRMFFVLQDLLEEKPELRKHILSVNSAIEELKEKL